MSIFSVNTIDNFTAPGYKISGTGPKPTNFSKDSLSKAKNNPINQIVIDAFNENSKYGYKNTLAKNPSWKPNDVQILCSEYTTYFLYALGIVAEHEGNFNSINTYDNGGLSVGIIQLANPTEGNPLMEFLKLLDNDIYLEVKEKFKNGSPYPGNLYTDVNSKKARIDKPLLQKIYDLLSTDRSKKIYLGVVIKYYFDPAFDVFLKVVKPKLYVNQDEGPLFVYASAFCFETNVQFPVQFKKINNTNMNEFLKIAGNKPTEGHFCYYFANKFIDLNTKSRDSDWNGINSAGPLMRNFKMQP
jgi:hypothetical protein